MARLEPNNPERTTSPAERWKRVSGGRACPAGFKHPNVPAAGDLFSVTNREGGEKSSGAFGSE
jgi:hypothetical protein